MMKYEISIKGTVDITPKTTVTALEKVVKFYGKLLYTVGKDENAKPYGLFLSFISFDSEVIQKLRGATGQIPLSGFLTNKIRGKWNGTEEVPVLDANGYKIYDPVFNITEVHLDKNTQIYNAVAPPTQDDDLPF